MRANLLPDSPVMHLPTALCKVDTVEAVLEDGSIQTLDCEENDLRRLVRIPVEKTVYEIRFRAAAVHCGGEEVRLFSYEKK